ncbi:hypothetical protein [Pseudomonas anguilliseptica]|uniref:hypothetical protein n=1 Tax=Pseudomonas anguilliseptica TaxID=53406 RepID=UPI001F43DAC4|nr:hypothetical protein [Pseudomonas anguilliseptica]MCE5365296.1 hypothetical protein [Pseudomonas anguilliseptica]
MALPLQGRLTGSSAASPKKVEANCADNRRISKEQRGYFVDSVTIGNDCAANVKHPAHPQVSRQHGQAG